jgi:hypothetical protein
MPLRACLVCGRTAPAAAVRTISDHQFHATGSTASCASSCWPSTRSATSAADRSTTRTTRQSSTTSSNDPANLKPAHRSCHGRKGAGIRPWVGQGHSLLEGVLPERTPRQLFAKRTALRGPSSAEFLNGTDQNGKAWSILVGSVVLSKKPIEGLVEERDDGARVFVVETLGRVQPGEVVSIALDPFRSRGRGD